MWRMKPDIARQIVGSVKLRDVMEYYGVKFNRRGFAKCPFHNEKTASLSIKNEHYKCFGCGAYGNAIDFVMQYHGLKFMQALVKLDNDFHLGLVGRRPTYRERMQERENKRIDEAEKRFKRNVHNQYLTLCVVHSILFRRLAKGEEWLMGIVEMLDEVLDDFSGEEARNWEMIIAQQFTQKKIS